MSPFVKFIAFALVALLAMSSLVSARPVMAEQRGTPTESLDARNVPARLDEPNANGLISDLTSALGLLSSKTGALASSTPTPLLNMTNTTVEPNKAANAANAATTSSTVASSLDVPTKDLQSVQKLLQDLVDSLSKNLKLAVDNIDELTTLL